MGKEKNIIYENIHKNSEKKIEKSFCRAFMCYETRHNGKSSKQQNSPNYTMYIQKHSNTYSVQFKANTR